jgi:hypothetical protein
MPSYANLAALSAILLQMLPALAAPANPDAWAEDTYWGVADHGDTTNIEINDGHHGFSHGGPDKGHGGSGGDHGHHDGGYYPPPPPTMTATMSDW